VSEQVSAALLMMTSNNQIATATATATARARAKNC
jgi:hypothetical protein